MCKWVTGANETGVKVQVTGVCVGGGVTAKAGRGGVTFVCSGVPCRRSSILALFIFLVFFSFLFVVFYFFPFLCVF